MPLAPGEHSAPNDPWSRHARQWSHVGSPLRPGPEDIAVFRAAIQEWGGHTGRSDPSVLVMGVTPELCGLPENGRVIAVDKSTDMIRSIWPGRLHEGDDAVCADWRSLPLAAASMDLALCDGGLSTLPYPSGYSAACEELQHVLRPEGRWVVRCFVQSDEPETTDEVLADLSSGGIGSFHVLKWRLAMALQPDAETGVPVASVWRVVHDAWDDLAHLAERFSWPLAHVQTIEAYLDVETRYSFPTLAQIRDLLTAVGFSIVAMTTPSYELGERCPILTLAAVEHAERT